jgi:phosphonoacetaldehyde hydrolase
LKKISAVILDWAGTTVDFGSFAPVNAFIKAFEAFGITPTPQETRAPMGMQKRAHIEQMLQGERIARQWALQHGHTYTQDDVSGIYAEFEPSLNNVLSQYATPLPDVPETVRALRDMGVKIGSTTGYTAEMMDIIVPIAQEKGYAPDSLVCPDETGGIGRPYPYMLWHNLEKLHILAAEEVVKVGDTIADIEEGINAGCISVGVIKGSNVLGLTEDELANLSTREKHTRFESAREVYIDAGADFVLDEISQLPRFIESLNPRGL